MDAVFICFMAVIMTAKTYHLDYQESDYEYDDYSDAKIIADNKTKQTSTGKATYEVTENVIDVQDNRTLGPIVANYSITRPLNTAAPITKVTQPNKDVTTATTSNKSTEPNEYTTTTINNDKVTQPNKDVTTFNNNKKFKKNYINLLHINAEYDRPDEIKIPLDSTNSYINDSKVNEYLNGIKQALVNGFNRVINKHKAFSLHDIVAGPLMFLRNLHKKGTDVADQFHKAILGNHLD